MSDFLVSRNRFIDALILDADRKTDIIQVHHALEKAVVAERAEVVREQSNTIEELEDQLRDATKMIPQWHPASDPPEEFVSVQAHMTDAGPFPSVREAYLAGSKWFFPALNEYHPVDKWASFSKMPLPAPPTEPKGVE